MANECKLCDLLGSTACCTSDNEETMKAHTEVHGRQVTLIEFIVEKPWMISVGSDTAASNNGEITNGKSMKSVLTFSRKLINSHGNNCAIKCSQCKIFIKSRPTRRAKTTKSLINHACSHLNKNLFACRHCDFKFVSKTGMLSHLKKAHAIRSKSENYIDMTEDHQKDIMDALGVCFGIAPNKKLDVKQRSNNQRSPLSKLAYNFMSKHEGEEHIQCHLCPRSIPSKQQRALIAKSLLDHACWHLDKPIFTCRLCPYSASTNCAIRMHLGHKHCVAKSKHNYKDVSSEHFEEISAIFEDCFDETKMDRPPVLTKSEVRARKRQHRILTRCGTNSLLGERKLRCTELAEKFHQSGKLKCRICHQQLTVANATKREYVRGMKHAYSHVNKPLISCRHCSYKCMTKAMIRRHVATKHGVSATNQFDDHTDDFHTDFMDMLSKCYDWDLEPSSSGVSNGVSSGSQKSKVHILSRSHGNDLKIARHVLAHDLVKKHIKDGKMICQVCNKATKVMGKHGSTIATAHLYSHALTHLDSRCWPYCCRLCSHTASNRPNISSHLKRVHKSGGTNGFEDTSDKFHEDIMKIVSKCYDSSIEAGEMS